MSGDRPTQATIRLGAITANLAHARDRAGVEPIAVVKADAYGHGAVPVARALAGAGCRRLAVVTTAEAGELREGGVLLPILVLGGLQAEHDAYACVEQGLIPVLQHEDELGVYREAARRAERRLPLQIEVDTGMSRMGLPAEALARVTDTIERDPWLVLDGLYTHLASADEADLEPTRLQLRAFGEALAALEAAGCRPRQVHVANSAGVLAQPELGADLPSQVNASRPGLMLYGVRPGVRDGEGLVPAMTVSSRIVNLRPVPAGAPVGYGGTFRAKRATRIATVALGYADGVPWSLANGTEMGLRGRRVPLVGRVSMDLVTLDVGEGPAELGDRVVFFGEGGPSVEEQAARAGTIGYELLVRLGRRVERAYVSVDEDEKLTPDGGPGN